MTEASRLAMCNLYRLFVRFPTSELVFRWWRVEYSRNDHDFEAVNVVWLYYFAIELVKSVDARCQFQDHLRR